MPGCAATANTLRLELLDNTTACSASLYSDPFTSKSSWNPEYGPGKRYNKVLVRKRNLGDGVGFVSLDRRLLKGFYGFPQRESLKPTQTSGQVDTGLNQEEASLIAFSWAGICSSRSWRDVVHDG